MAALGEFGARVGVAFQLVDDVLDYDGDPRATGKALLGDLLEGKLTLPLIRALAARPALLDDVEAVRAGDARAAARVAEAVRASGVVRRRARARPRGDRARARRALERRSRRAPRATCSPPSRASSRREPRERGVTARRSRLG